MKLFNEIEAEIKGKIVKILVDDSSPVEYDQPLFLVEPA
jgi:acetyl-CoA carboxylase biotin carboxyl carrier protein